MAAYIENYDEFKAALLKNQELQGNIRKGIEEMESVLAGLDDKIRIVTGQMMDREAGIRTVPSKTWFQGSVLKDPTSEERRKYGLCKKRDELRECMKPFIEESILAAGAGKRKSDNVNNNDSREEEEEEEEAEDDGWSEAKEQKLIAAVEEHEGHDWNEITRVSESGKSVLETFQHYQQSLNNTLSRDVWTAEEDAILIENFEVCTCVYITYIY
jgi:hypothetical protein